MRDIKRIIRRLDLKKKMNKNNAEVFEAYEFALKEVKALLVDGEERDEFTIILEEDLVEKESLNLDEFEDVVWRDIREIQLSRI